MNLSRIDDQIRYSMRKAWCNRIENAINKNPPDIDFIVKLYLEIKERLLKILKKNSDNYRDINESLDSELFKQMITNDVFNKDDFKNLVYYLSQCCIKLGSADQDEIVIEKRNKMIYKIDNSNNIFEVISLFFLEINICIDKIYEDIDSFIKTFTG